MTRRSRSVGAVLDSRSATTSIPRSAASSVMLIARDEVRPDELAEGRLDRGRRAGSTTSSSSTRRPPRRLAARAMPRASSSARRAVRASARPRRAASVSAAAARRSALAARLASAVSSTTRAASRAAIASASARGGLGEGGAGLFQVRLEADPPRRRGGLGGALIRGPSLRLCHPAASRLLLGLASCGGASQRGQLFALGLPSGPQTGKLGDGLGECPLCLRQCRLAVEIARRYGHSRGTPLARQVGLGRFPLSPPPGCGRDRPPRAPR